MLFWVNRKKADPRWLEWYDQITWREKAHYHIGIALGRFENWICFKPDWISKHDFWYQYGEKGARPICWVLGHFSICTNYRNVWHCATCGKYPLPENPHG